MFSVYGLSGPVFQGTLESLSRFPPVTQRGPAEAVRRVGNFDESEIEQQTGAGATSGVNAQALAEYRAMLPRDLERGPIYHARQIMRPEVVTIGADESVTQAWQTLIARHIRQAPVLDAEARLVGIVSERDLLTSLNVEAAQVRDVLSKRVRDVMSTPVVAASPLTDIRRLARVMLDRHVDGVPIVDDSGLLAGFVSRSDILHAVVTDPPLSVWR